MILLGSFQLRILCDSVLGQKHSLCHIFEETTIGSLTQYTVLYNYMAQADTIDQLFHVQQSFPKAKSTSVPCTAICGIKAPPPG